MTSLVDFWNLVKDVWQTGVFGVDIGRVIVALLITIVFFMFRQLFTRFFINRMAKLAAKTQTRIDDEILTALENPVRLIPVVLGFFIAAEYLQLSGPLAVFTHRALRSLIVFIIFWGLVNVIKPMSFLLRRLEKVFTSSMVDWLIKAVKVSLIIIGAATILEIWGIRVGPIIAGLGLFGVAVALGAQDLFKNLISGILIIAERRFNRGDWILVEGVVEGTVEDIGFRSTLVRRFDKAPVFVPNSLLSDKVVTNFSAMTHRRIYWKIGVVYHTTVDQLRRIRDEIEAYVLNTPEFAKPPEVLLFVRIDGFSDSAIDIMLYCFTRTTRWGEWLAIKEKLAYQIKQIVEGAGTGFAFPSRSLYVESMPADAPEDFIPPES